MGDMGNIVIGDESALHLLLHCDRPESIGADAVRGNPLASCAASAEGLRAFNTEHPLYGGKPVCVLVNDPRNRRPSSEIVCRCCTRDLPEGSFYKLRDGLYVASAQLAFVRMAVGQPFGKIAEIGLNLCSRYYIHCATGSIETRSRYLVTPRQLGAYLAAVRGMRGSRKAASALAWVAPNSGSPMESKTWLQFCLPRSRGGFGLPFDAMNYDVSAGRLAGLTTQHNFSIDLVNRKRKFGLEYDGADYHTDAARDIRRRNELSVLGWTILPIGKDTLKDPEATERVAHQIAHHLGHRLRDPENWERCYSRLRKSLQLPT